MALATQVGILAAPYPTAEIAADEPAEIAADEPAEIAPDEPSEIAPDEPAEAAHDADAVADPAPEDAAADEAACASARALLADARTVTILAGAANSMPEPTLRRLEPLLERGLEGYPGVLLSGGTDVGMPGIAGRAARRNRLALIGYVATDATASADYELVRTTARSTEFTVLEPLVMWSDILAGAIEPARVTMLACPGGAVTLQEIAVARALGAKIGWLDPADQAVEALDEVLTLGADEIVQLPADAMTIRAFTAGSTGIDLELRAGLARFLHNAYRREQVGSKPAGDPALTIWDELPEPLRASNLAWADHIPDKLALIGLQLERDGEQLSFTPDQIELLAEVEHGRFNAERLSAGWRVGPRRIGHNASPYLVPWTELRDDIREYDRAAVRNIAPALRDAGWGVARA